MGGSRIIMKVAIFENYNEMSKRAAAIIADCVKEKPDCILGLATGSTPIGLYSELAAMYAAGTIDFSNVTTFNLDEYYPIKQSDPQSYYYFMQENLFSKINVLKEKINIPFGDADDPLIECQRYHGKINNSNGIDIQVLGIGNNGHIGFNEPSDNLSLNTHYVALTEDTIDANARFFDSMEDVPKHALSMGVGEIMSARKILMLISGKGKAQIVKKLFSNQISTQVPASLLPLHKDVVVLLDKDAASLLAE